MKFILFLLLIMLSINANAQEKTSVIFVYEAGKTCEVSALDADENEVFSILKTRKLLSFTKPTSESFTVKKGKKLLSQSDEVLAIRKKNRIKFENKGIEIIEKCNENTSSYFLEDSEIVQLSFEHMNDNSYKVQLTFDTNDLLSTQVAYLGVASLLRDLENDNSFLTQAVILGSTLGVLAGLML